MELIERVRAALFAFDATDGYKDREMSGFEKDISDKLSVQFGGAFIAIHIQQNEGITNV